MNIIYIYIFQLCPIHLYLQYYHSKYRGKIILLFNIKNIFKYEISHSMRDYIYINQCLKK